MSQTESIQPPTKQWMTICPLDRILPNTGVCALVNDRQIAVFRVGEGMDVYAIDNYDPFSKAYVLSRGIVGDRQGVPKVASPIYKQNFSLLTGECLDDSTVKLQTFPVLVIEGEVRVNA
jgi:nitrite reductase (NADH) small subunit